VSIAQLSDNSSGGFALNQQIRTPAAAKGTSSSMQPQHTVAYRATSAGSTATASSTPPKHSHHRESGKSSPRAQVASSQHGVTTTQIPTEPKGISQPLLERGGKRPPRPQAIRLAGKDQTVYLLLQRWNLVHLRTITAVAQ
jgi:hypothetical protein